MSLFHCKENKRVYFEEVEGHEAKIGLGWTFGSIKKN